SGSRLPESILAWFAFVTSSDQCVVGPGPIHSSGMGCCRNSRDPEVLVKKPTLLQPLSCYADLAALARLFGLYRDLTAFIGLSCSIQFAFDRSDQRFQKMMVASRTRGGRGSKPVARVVGLGTRTEPAPSKAHGGPEVYRSRCSPYASRSHSTPSGHRARPLGRRDPAPPGQVGSDRRA